MSKNRALNPQTRLDLLASDGSHVENLSLSIVRHATCKRYILRVPDRHRVQVTIPRCGSVSVAIDLVHANRTWIARQLARRREETAEDAWSADSRVLYRGQYWPVLIDTDPDANSFTVGDRGLIVSGPTTKLRTVIEAGLVHQARQELPHRTRQLARELNIRIGSVVIRDQRTRWGSCSLTRNISLNWRLIQMPPFVSDYVIVHELMHCLEMNHSRRFWQLVAGVCPDIVQAKQWLRKHSRALMKGQGSQPPT